MQEGIDKMSEIYHGSNQSVKNPKVLVQGFYKDFGFGFYCTKYERQAVRWALTKKGTHCVNVYTYEPSETLKTKFFCKIVIIRIYKHCKKRGDRKKTYKASIDFHFVNPHLFSFIYSGILTK